MNYRHKKLKNPLKDKYGTGAMIRYKIITVINGVSCFSHYFFPLFFPLFG